MTPSRKANENRPIAPLLLGPRTLTRLLVVAGFLLLVFTWRVDQAVRTAYDTGWFAPSEEGTPAGCTDCLRLPSQAWVEAHAVAPLFAFGFLLVATLLWRRRCVAAAGTTELRRTTVVGLLVVVACAVGSGVARGTADEGAGSYATVILALDVVALAVTAAVALAMTNLLYRSVGQSLAGAVATFVRRQRMNLVLVLFLVVALTVVADTSGQAIDSIRTWNPFPTVEGVTSWSRHGTARLLMGLASALLLSLVLYESAVRLSQAPSGTSDIAPLRWFGALGATALVAGLLLWSLAGFGPGIALAGALLLLILVLELPKLTGQYLVTGPPPARPLEQRGPEWLAITPLLALAATAEAAMVDAGLSGGLNLDAVLTGIPVLVFALFAVLMTAELAAPAIQLPSVGTSAAVVALILLSGVVLIPIDSIVAAAVVGGGWLIALTLYALRLFRIPSRAGAPTFAGLGVALGFGAGLAALGAVHLDPLETGRALGVFALTHIALAFAIVVFHPFVRATLLYRPPKLLWWFGFQQLPALSLIALWWIGVGLIGSDTLHDVRIVDRSPVPRAAGAAYPARPDLAVAFRLWVNAQPELRGDAPGRPVPMAVVAAHGGGIRAAYWTALALDCLVGVSAAGIDRATLTSDDEAVRERTCTTTRRTSGEQRAAARRIFLASGVSGGAVGLYAYVRQLLHNGELGDGRWVDGRLNRDFAAPAIGWALFHDLPNRLLGLHPTPGGGCALEARDVCFTNDRAAVLEDAFDGVWTTPGERALLRRTHDLRRAQDPQRRNAQLAPLLVTNATLTGGRTRAVLSAANLGAWPARDVAGPRRPRDRLPLAGTIEVTDALCATGDVRLSTAALLAARFPYVTPSGHVPGGCERGDDGLRSDDRRSVCANLDESVCEGSFVDGGYADNSGLFTIIALWPSLRSLIVQHNATHTREIAPLIIELDNHYQASLKAPVPSGGTEAETLIPLVTAFGGRAALETYARAAAHRLLPRSCVVTLSPSLHPGLIAPLGWELSPSARDDLRAGLTRRYPGAGESDRHRAIFDLRRLQDRLAGPGEEPARLAPGLEDCVPV